MPSSVVFAALVLAWLVVLVPVVARRRQMVPRPAEADLSARVLRRTAGASMIEEVPVADTHRDGRGGTPAASSGAPAAVAVAERTDERPTTTVASPEVDVARPRTAADTAARERVLRRAEPAPDTDAYGDDEDDDLGDEYADSYDEYEYADDDAYDDADDDEAPSSLPRPYRPGRGGFDPDAAAAAAHARYAFRQRVAIGLIAVAVLSALAALVVTGVLWWLHVITDIVLVGYLFFLRRQTRIEEEVRARRAARLSGERRALEARRARQEEHEARMAACQEDAWDAEYDTEYDDLEADLESGYLDEEPAPAPRWAAPRTPAPPVPADMELVADSDDDPAFHDLEGERIPNYRRAAAGA